MRPFMVEEDAGVSEVSFFFLTSLASLAVSLVASLAASFSSVLIN
jgi:hypothetical protein